jgi:Tfp pilus assembly protein PilF
MSIRVLIVGMLTAAALCSAAEAQVASPRERAMPLYATGLEHMSREAFDAAAKSFQAAIDIDQDFEMAHYMLGRTHLVRRNYMPAVYALEKARDLFVTQGTQQFTTKAERQSELRRRVSDLDQLIEETRAAASVPANKNQAFSLLEQARQYEERKRQIQDMIRNEEAPPQQAVPGYVSLSLGSAYFRAGKTGDAERAYRAAIAADPKIGEAHNNLAVIYMETGRLNEAEKAIAAAEAAGLRVNPALKEEIRKRR